MGVSESSQKNCNESLNTFITDVLGSFDCTCKSKCCDPFKCINLYYHCQTIKKEDDLTDSEEKLTPRTLLSENLLN